MPWLALVTPALLVALWALVSSFGFFPESLFPHPWAVARGLVIEATGAGNIPPAALPGVRAALAASVPVVVVSRCAEGRVAPLYGYEGGGQMLRELGVIFGHDLPGPKARIKLMVALGTTSDVSAIRGLFEPPA